MHAHISGAVKTQRNHSPATQSKKNCFYSSSRATNPLHICHASSVSEGQEGKNHYSSDDWSQGSEVLVTCCIDLPTVYKALRSWAVLLPSMIVYSTTILNGADTGQCFTVQTKQSLSFCIKYRYIDTV